MLLRLLSERTLPVVKFEDCDSSLSFNDNRIVSAQGFGGDVRPPCIKILLLFNLVALWKIRPPEIKQIILVVIIFSLIVKCYHSVTFSSSRLNFSKLSTCSFHFHFLLFLISCFVDWQHHVTNFFQVGYHLPHRSLCRFIPKYTTITANISLSYFSKNKPASNFIVTYFYPSLPCCYLVEFDYNTFFNTFLPSILSESEVTSVQCQTPEREKSNTWLH